MAIVGLTFPQHTHIHALHSHPLHRTKQNLHVHNALSLPYMYMYMYMHVHLYLHVHVPNMYLPTCNIPKLMAWFIEQYFQVGWR